MRVAFLLTSRSSNFTFNSKAVVYNPKQIMIAEAVFASEYVRGNGVTFFKNKSQFDFENYAHGADILVRLVPYEERDFPNPMDITGEHFIPDANPMYEEWKGMHFSSALYYRIVDGIMDLVTENKTVRANDSTDGAPHFGNFNRVQTTTCWGTQFSYNHRSGQFDVVHENTGHTGRFGEGRGVAKVLAGGDQQLEKQDWKTYSLA